MSAPEPAPHPLDRCQLHTCPSCGQWTASMRRHVETHDRSEHEELLRLILVAEVMLT